MFHIYTDHWWRNPKHAVTTEATLVQVGEPEHPTGNVVSGPYSPSPSGRFQTVTADVIDPQTGQTVRATGEFYSATGSYQVGQRLRVRWSAKRKAVEPWQANTAPEDELSGASPASAGSAPLFGGGLSADQAARVQQALSTLGLGTAGVQVVRINPGAAGGVPDPVSQLERLAALHASGALTDEEFAKEKDAILHAP
jgi:hypothetical protein